MRGRAHQSRRLVEAVAAAAAAVNGALRFCFEPLQHVQEVTPVTAALAPAQVHEKHICEQLRSEGSSATHHMVQSALASAAEALPPPAVRVPRGIRHTQQRGSGRLQFGQAIGRVEDAEADDEAAAQR